VTIQDLGSIGEFVAAIATLATLGYLALQIRQNTKQMRASTFQATSRGWQEFIYAIFREDRGILWAKGLEGLDTLNEEERINFFLLVRAYLRGFENDYYQYKQGTFDLGPWEGYLNSFRSDCLARPGFRALWEQERESFNSEFAALVDRELKSTTVGESAGLLDAASEFGRAE
jgi:hypothetical protein